MNGGDEIKATISPRIYCGTTLSCNCTTFHSLARSVQVQRQKWMLF